MEVSNKLGLIIVVSFAIIIPCLGADMVQYDDVWKRRAQEAKKNMMITYIPNPLEVTQEFDSQFNQ